MTSHQRREAITSQKKGCFTPPPPPRNFELFLSIYHKMFLITLYIGQKCKHDDGGERELALIFKEAEEHAAEREERAAEREARWRETELALEEQAGQREEQLTSILATLMGHGTPQLFSSPSAHHPTQSMHTNIPSSHTYSPFSSLYPPFASNLPPTSFPYPPIPSIQPDPYFLPSFSFQPTSNF